MRDRNANGASGKAVRYNRELLLRGLPWLAGLRAEQLGRQRSTGLASAPAGMRIGYARGLGLATLWPAPAEFRSR